MIYAYSFIGVECETFAQKIQACLANLNILMNLDITDVNSFHQFLLISSRKGGLSEQRFINGDAKAPNIDLMIIKLIVQNLRCHIQRSTTIEFDHFIFSELCRKSEVTQLNLNSFLISERLFQHLLYSSNKRLSFILEIIFSFNMKQNISVLDVTMQDPTLKHLSHSQKYLSVYIAHVPLQQKKTFFHKSLQIAAIAVLNNKVEMSARFEARELTYNIWV